MTLGDVGAAIDTAVYFVVVLCSAVLLIRLIRNGIKSVASAESNRFVFFMAIAFNSYGIPTYWVESSYVRCGLATLTVTLLSAYVYVVNRQIDRLGKAVK